MIGHRGLRKCLVHVEVTTKAFEKYGTIVEILGGVTLF